MSATRLAKIAWVLSKQVLNRRMIPKRARTLRTLSYFNPFSYQTKISRGKSLRIALENLGPIYIKFGQLLSTRFDLIPEDILNELEVLQDRTTPFSSELAIQKIESSFGKKINELYASFDTNPLASASIAQVHAATLKNGERVVVKIIRPKIKKTIRQDIAVMKWVAKCMERFWRHGKGWGLKGVLTGFILEPYLNAFTMAFFLFFSKRFKEYQLLHHLIANCSFDRSSLLDFIRGGAGLLAQIGCDFSLTLLLIILAGFFGPTAQAAYTIAFLMQSMNNIINLCFGLAGWGTVDDAIQNQHVSREFAYLLSAMPFVVSFGVGSIIPVICASYPTALTAIAHNDNPEVESYLRHIILLVAAASAMDSANFQGAFIPRAWQAYLSPIKLRLIGNMVGLVAAAILGFCTDLRGQSVAPGYMVAMGLTAILLITYNCKHFREQHASKPSVFLPTPNGQQAEEGAGNRLVVGRGGSK